MFTQYNGPGGELEMIGITNGYISQSFTLRMITITNANSSQIMASQDFTPPSNFSTRESNFAKDHFSGRLYVLGTADG